MPLTSGYSVHRLSFFFFCICNDRVWIFNENAVKLRITTENTNGHGTGQGRRESHAAQATKFKQQNCLSAEFYPTVLRMIEKRSKFNKASVDSPVVFQVEHIHILYLLFSVSSSAAVKTFILTIFSFNFVFWVVLGCSYIIGYLSIAKLKKEFVK